MAHQSIPKIFHGPHKNPPAAPPTYLMYSPLYKVLSSAKLKTSDLMIIKNK